jgi:amino acid permease
MLSDMFGLGTLSLPGDFARLGWAPAVTATLLLAAGGIYTGSLYQRLSLRVPAAKVFDQIGQEAHGKWGSVSVYLTIYMAILGEPVSMIG